MDSCALNISISALACAIAEGKTDDQINLLAAFFVQLGDSLTTIVAANSCNNNENNKNNATA